MQRLLLPFQFLTSLFAAGGPYATGAAGAHFRSYVRNPTPRPAVLHFRWDDAITVRLNGQVIFDTR